MDTAPSTLELALDAPAVFHAPSCSPLRVLVACEYSGAVRDAFRALGHDAMSCDLLPTDADGPHYCGDVRDVLDYPWDIMIAHPPCTHLSVSGARHFEAKRMDGRQQSAVSFFMMLARAPIPKIAIENPVCIMSTMWRKPDQVIQPWQFGHGETKATCLWLKGLPPLTPTNIVEGREQRIWKMPPSPDRWKERSKTFAGIAAAMAAQWGGVCHANVEGHLPLTGGGTSTVGWGYHYEKISTRGGSAVRCAALFGLSCFKVGDETSQLIGVVGSPDANTSSFAGS